VRLESVTRETLVRRESVVAVVYYQEKVYDTTWNYGTLHDLHSCQSEGPLAPAYVEVLSNRQFKPNTCLPTQLNSTQLNWTISKHVLEISFIHVCKTQLNPTQHNSTQLN
jgi:hypothetical protein